MVRYLFVANQTLGGPALEEVVRARMKREREGILGTEAEFHIVVPATAPEDQHTPSEGEARVIAAGRLEQALERLRSVGAQVTGEVGAEDPVQAISEAFGGQRGIESGYVEIIISTLPRGISKWLRTDLPHQIERKFDLAVTTIESPAN